jgi:hypothetical protein
MHGLLGEHEWWQQVHGEHRAQISQAYILGNAFANPQVLEDGLLPLDASNLPPFLQPPGRPPRAYRAPTPPTCWPPTASGPAPVRSRGSHAGRRC